MNAKEMMSSLFYGLCTVFIIVIGLSLILSLLLKFTSLTEHSLTIEVLVFSFIALFIGGFVSGKKGKEKGWMLGGGTGLLFSLIVFLFQFLGYQSGFSLEQLLYHIGYIIIAVFGGIFGVNLSGKKRTI